MGIAKYYHSSSIKGKDVHYISADPSTINVNNINGKSLTASSSGYFGINGTFFDKESETVSGIACTSGGTPVGKDGTGSSAVYKRGTLVQFRQNNGVNPTISKFQLTNIADVGFPLSWIDWAISGLNLYLDDSSITDSTKLTAKLKSAEHGQSVNKIDPPEQDDRAAIGYKSSTQKIILANIKEATAWEAREVMRYFACDYAILLDGSNATQMRAKLSNGNVVTNGGGRNIYSVVTVNNATWQ
ncbi:phosphodiester glycosidase family protein [Saccharibacillus sp. CPCC 101409]|uniref:phosphodiester glycosidase family protein n=1 Tax=Saccharibacillus sp. CPCC 101409 TaxID=3058041 RepID=UPI00267364FF|nr:phosphodiester glycosidase family protein [Saccharibacillus sp. CPCC 101409]MDO3411572.1 phosphodiester glycosidase family protein [Saccharibacillus sp. CPCC 101409]